MNKLESGEVRFLSVPFEMEPLLHEIDPVLQSQASENGVQLKTQYSAEPLHLIGSPAHIKQILINIANNAFKYTPAGGTVSVQVQAVEQDQLNPELHIMTDYQRFDELVSSAVRASSVINKVDILKNALDLYHGKVLSSADGEHWLIQFSTKYHLSYMGTVSELLKQLDSLHSYDLLNDSFNNFLVDF